MREFYAAVNNATANSASRPLDFLGARVETAFSMLPVPEALGEGNEVAAGLLPGLYDRSR